ncbi:uncharacterized protein VP01_266g7 [Puccinia sorghi]|uniref:Uncharacterized protein n=1 Tax=Puccinia sorghi TaxID=27349 RepID=A0A0L6V4N5_9BASI|nr:uncharacterized protein VP01_266g7 [Puccinia sorghi]
MTSSTASSTTSATTALKWPSGTSARPALCRPTPTSTRMPTPLVANTPLMSLYQHGLRQKIQLAVVMSNIEFDSLRSMKAMALKAGQKIEGIWQEGRPVPSASTPAPKPNAMDLSAFQKSPGN